MTIDPEGTGETFASVGITIQVHVYHSLLGTPVSGVPASEILLYPTDWDLCLCEPVQADHPTDANGDTEFTGTILGGGCTQSLSLFVDGVWSCSFPVRINSTDSGVASPCAVDASDLALLVTKLGRPQAYDFCFDYNDSGNIDASDLACLAAALGDRCR